MTVTPAYGRDYRNKADALKDWKAGKDFRCAMSGRYLSVRDNIPDVWIRYAKLTKVVKAQ
jgi:hypothetical protein